MRFLLPLAVAGHPRESVGVLPVFVASSVFDKTMPIAFSFIGVHLMQSQLSDYLSYFFEIGPGVCKPKPAYFTWLVFGFCTIICGIGFPIIGVLFLLQGLASSESKKLAQRLEIEAHIKRIKDKAPLGINSEGFEAIQGEMTKDEVALILGSSGTMLSETGDVVKIAYSAEDGNRTISVAYKKGGLTEKNKNF